MINLNQATEPGTEGAVQALGFPVLIGETTVLSGYADKMAAYAQEYLAAAVQFQADPPEEPAPSEETVATEGEDPGHHTGSPVGYPTGE